MNGPVLSRLLSTLRLNPCRDRRMTRGRIGALSLNSCGSFIGYSPPALTGAFPDTLVAKSIPQPQIRKLLVGDDRLHPVAIQLLNYLD